MTISSIFAPPLAPQVAHVSTPPSAPSVATLPAHNEAINSSPLPRMQNLGLTNLGQTLMQGILGSYVSPRLSVLPNSDQAKAGALTVVGGMAKVAGQTMAKSGGATSKAVGAALTWGGKTAEKIGKADYKEAGKDNSTGNYNAFAPRNWAK